MSLRLGPGVTRHFAAASAREWLVTNGLGGWASGTVSGANTRRYHGLLVPALQPPLGRTVLVSQANARARHPGGAWFALNANEYADGHVQPPAELPCAGFELEAGLPAWYFAVDGVPLEKRLWMVPGRDLVFLVFRLPPSALGALDLEVQVMVTCRDAHAETRQGGGPPPTVVSHAGQPRVTLRSGEVQYYLAASAGSFEPEAVWHPGLFHRAEAERGLPPVEDHFAAGRFGTTLQPGQSWALTFSLDAAADPSAWESSLAAVAQRARGLVAQAGLAAEPAWVQQLVLAADQFVVRRSQGQTVIAGYHWFGDWGRDTMIALPGLCLATHRYDAAVGILRTFARYVSQGMLPNRFPDAGQAPEYNTVDATLWYFHAVDRYVEATGDEALARELLPVLADIIAWHRRGTRYRIGVDPSDGLLHAGEPGSQLTWMDVRIGDWTVTPRTGKPVEINALWINALRVMAALCARLGVPPAEPYAALTQRAVQSFGRFWYAQGGYLYDVIDGPTGADAALRPNQVIALALPRGPYADLAGERLSQARSILAACTTHLLTPFGLRTLSPGHPKYRPRFQGDPVARDSAYHQGTVWPWLIGPLVDAHLRVYRDRAAARRLLLAFEGHLAEVGLGTISEVFEPEPPYAPGACMAQAWSVAEVLRGWLATSPVKA